jgi:hypothetical protein
MPRTADIYRGPPNLKTALGWKQLPLLSNEQLGRRDIAAVNLVCASEFPDAATVDFELCLRRIDEWAEIVRRFTDPRVAAGHWRQDAYNHSEPFFRAMAMVTVLQRDLGVRYNPAKIPKEVPLDPADSFIYGVVLGEGGTCASMPVLYTAVGRRLGYPLKLVSTRVRNEKAGHLFARWDDPKGERFNLDGSGHGMSSEPDEHYRSGPTYDCPPDAEKYGLCLQSKTPRQELANFLFERGMRWLDLGSRRQAVDALAWSHVAAPENVLSYNRMCHEIDDWNAELEKRKPRQFPVLEFDPWRRRFPDPFKWTVEKDILVLEATENLLNNPHLEARCWAPQRRGQRPAVLPDVAIFRWRDDGCDLELTLRPVAADAAV